MGIILPFIGQRIPHRPLTPEERDKYKDLILDTYDEFTEKVATGRGMTQDEVHEVGQGRIWSGSRGKEIGLVDEIGGMCRALEIARDAAGIPADKDVHIVELPGKGFINPAMFRISPFGVQEQEYELQYMRMILEAKGRPVVLTPPELIPEF